MIEMHPLLAWVLALGAIAGATGAIWRIWIGPAVNGIREVLWYIKRIASVVEKFEAILPCIMQMLEDHPRMLIDHDERLDAIERHVGIKE